MAPLPSPQQRSTPRASRAHREWTGGPRQMTSPSFLLLQRHPWELLSTLPHPLALERGGEDSHPPLNSLLLFGMRRDNADADREVPQDAPA